LTICGTNQIKKYKANDDDDYDDDDDRDDDYHLA
jgi:hypothetical protein